MAGDMGGDYWNRSNKTRRAGEVGCECQNSWFPKGRTNPCVVTTLFDDADTPGGEPVIYNMGMLYIAEGYGNERRAMSGNR